MSQSTQTSSTHDVIIIGGGIIGSAIALRLAQAGVRVLVVDRGQPASEASGAAAGMLAPQGERLEPEDFSDLCMASRNLYPDFAAEVESLSGEPVGYRSDGTLLVAVEEEESQELSHTHHAQTRRGLSLELLDGSEARKRLPDLSPDVRCALSVPGDHWLDNEKLLRAVVKAAERAGATFAWNTAATGFGVRQGRIESVTLKTPQQTAPETSSAGHFVLAAGCWSRELAASLGVSLKMKPCHGQLIEFESSTDLPLVVRCGHHYLVPRPGKRILAGTTAEYIGFEKAVTGEGLRSILEGIARLVPLLKNLRFRRAWSGLRPDTSDHLPILGYGELKNLLFATGHFRNGILLAPVTAQLIAELVLKGNPSRSLENYRPGRFSGSD